MFNEYPKYDAMGLTELIKKGDVAPSEVIEAAIHQIEKWNPKINAVVHKMYDFAREKSKQFQKTLPLAGVPFLVKDLGMDIAGFPTSGGSFFTKDYVAQTDSEIYKRYRETGLIALGKTNVPEFGLMGVTESYLWGPCRNPWDLNLTSGGSSGGSAAAVAARMVPIATADDGGGSIRIPASACGLFGFKPSRGLQPMGPYKNESWLSLVSGHVLTRSVRDSALVLEHTKGLGLGAPYGPTRNPQSLINNSNASMKGKKVAFTRNTLFGQGLSNVCEQALQHSLKVCEDLGMEVIEAEPKLNKDDLMLSFYVILTACTAGEVSRLEKNFGKKATLKNVEHVTWFLKAAGEKLRASDLENALFHTRQSTLIWEKFFQDYDYFCTPTMAYEPSPIGLMNISAIEKLSIRLAEYLPMSVIMKSLMEIGKRASDRIPDTFIFNMSGHPSMSVPSFFADVKGEGADKKQLPIGIQFTGRMGEDDHLFALAFALENAIQWSSQSPDK